MGLETVDFIEDFIATNPVGGTDPKSEGDDHIRNIKKGILANLPNLGREAARISASQLNAFTGMIVPFPLAVVDGVATGWLYCNGQAVLRADYPDLFAYLGLTYGPGNGVDDFVVPDYRGYFLRGQADGSSRDPDRDDRNARDDGTAGDEPGTTQGDNFKDHDHDITIDDPGHGHGASDSGHDHTADRYNQTGSGDAGFLGNDSDGVDGELTVDSGNANITVDDNNTGITATANIRGGLETRPLNIYVRYHIHI